MCRPTQASPVHRAASPYQVPMCFPGKKCRPLNTQLRLFLPVPLRLSRSRPQCRALGLRLWSRPRGFALQAMLLQGFAQLLEVLLLSQFTEAYQLLVTFTFRIHTDEHLRRRFLRRLGATRARPAPRPELRLWPLTTETTTRRAKGTKRTQSRSLRFLHSSSSCSGGPHSETRSSEPRVLPTKPFHGTVSSQELLR